MNTPTTTALGSTLSTRNAPDSSIRTYCDERYKPIRQRFDFDDQASSLVTLLRKDDKDLTPGERNELDRVTDYLNFFEWIAFLEKRKQLAFRDLDAMFNYYLQRMVAIDRKFENALSQYLRSNGFEQLLNLLSKHYPKGRVVE